MKKNFLGVCLCLLLAASMGMAAGYDEIMEQGTDWGRFLEIAGSFSEYSTQVQEDRPDLALPDVWSVTEGFSFDNGVWDPASMSLSPDDDRSWDFLVIAWFDYLDPEFDIGVSPIEWFYFEKDYDVEGFNSFLTVPEGFRQDFAWAYGVNLGNHPRYENLGGDPIPEPGTLLLLGTGVVGLGLIVKRRKMKK